LTNCPRRCVTANTETAKFRGYLKSQTSLNKRLDRARIARY
jgi:hypothetical protein